MRALWWSVCAAAVMAGCVDWNAAVEQGCAAKGVCGADASVGGGSGGATGGGSGGSTGGGTGGDVDSGTGGSTGGGTGGSTDAGESDAGPTDAGAADAGASDAGATDAGTTDAGATDAGLPDAGPTDSGVADAGFNGTFTILVADTANHRLVSLAAPDGGGWYTLPAVSQGLTSPQKLSFDSTGKLYIADTGNARIVRMDDFAGTNQTAFGKWGDLHAIDWGNRLVPPAGFFQSPTSVYVNQYDDTVQVVDSSYMNEMWVFAWTWNGANVINWRGMSDPNWTLGWYDAYGPPGGPSARPGFWFSRGFYTTTCCSLASIEYASGGVPGANTPGNASTMPSSPNVLQDVWASWNSIYTYYAGTIDVSAGFPTLYTTYSTSGEQGVMAGFGGPAVAPATRYTQADNAAAKTIIDGGVNYGTLKGITGDSFNWPQGLAVDSTAPGATQGFVYVADTYNHRVVRTLKNLTGGGWKVLGGLGAGALQFKNPYDVKVGPDGKLYVVDTGNDRIVRVDDMNGTNWTTFGSTAGSGVGQFRYPRDVTYGPDGKIYMADTDNGRVIRMDDPSGAGWVEFGPTFGVKRLFQPTRIRVTSRGIWILDSGHSPPQVDFMTDMTGAGWQYFQPGGTVGNMSSPQGLAVDANGHVFIADTGNHRIIEVDDFDGTNFGGTTYAAVGVQGTSGAGKFNSPLDIAVDRTGTQMYVADTMNHRLVMLDHPANKAALSLTTWYELTLGTWVTNFDRPSTVTVDVNGKLWVADTWSHRIIRMDDFNGTNLVIYGTDGSGKNQFLRPMGIAVK